MLVKIALISLMILCFLILGEELHKSYKNRYKDVSDLIKILEILHMELGFGLYTLSEVFNKISNKKEFLLCSFFGKLSKELEENNSDNLDGILNKTIHLITEKTSLRIKEIDELKNLILNLGKSDFYSQERIIDLTIENIKKIQEEAYVEISNKGVLYKKITLIMGFLVAIILF